MGKKGKEKKKGKGAEKTAAKTEKKMSNKMKKELQKLGEEDIESIVNQIEKEERKRLEVTETTIEAPSRRLNFSFIAHPDKEQLILFGGEFFDGQKTLVYNDLFFYNIPNSTWSILKAPGGPAPRCGHQMVATSANKGQLWVFGGEFSSPSQAQFYHYRDLWIYHLFKKQWEKIQAPNGPSARSGHRMVIQKKQLIVFGGFHDNLMDYKYFNDVHLFNMETYKWTKIEPLGTAPAPRSACCMAALNDGRVLIYGGYSKERIKKDVDKGHVFTDSFVLVPDKMDTTGTKWKWQQIKIGGSNSFTPRCSMPMTTAPNNSSAYCYGGVFDTEDDEENLAGNFYNDLLALDLEKLTWKSLYLSAKKDIAATKKTQDPPPETGDSEMQGIQETVEATTISDDGIFKVTVGPAPAVFGEKQPLSGDSETIFQPSPRINCGLAVKHGNLFLYGGMFEDGDRQITYCDFYSLDLRKLEEWKVLAADDLSKIEWLGSDSESGEEDSQEEDDEDDDEDDEDSGESEEMETD